MNTLCTDVQSLCTDVHWRAFAVHWCAFASALPCQDRWNGGEMIYINIYIFIYIGNLESAWKFTTFAYR